MSGLRVVIGSVAAGLGVALLIASADRKGLIGMVAARAFGPACMLIVAGAALAVTA
jgi:hypothetical protein